MDLDSLVARKAKSEVEATTPQSRPLLTLSVPEGYNPQSYFACLLASSLSVIFLGIQITLTLLMWARLPQAATEELTNVGIFNFRPERDVLIYVLGLPVTLGMVIAHAWLWNFKLRRRLPLSSAGGAALLGAAQLGVGLVATGIYLYQYTAAQQYALRGEPIPRTYLVLFALVAQMLVVVAMAWPRKFASFSVPEELARPRPKKWMLGWDLLFAVVVILIVYVPSYDQLSGHVFQAERFFHWDFFGMGPALGFESGAALGTDTFAFYGRFWPVLFSWRSPMVKLTYGSMIHISVIYGCIYFIGLYLLIKLVTNRPIWAAAGTLLALRIHLFSGLAFLSPLWRFPSVTVMRRPFDVWFFIALVMFHKTGRKGWLLGAAGLTGAGLLFETDTGLYLVAAMGLYWLGKLIQSPDRRADVKLLAVSVGIALGVLFAGLLVASRGTVFSPAFWRGWLENLELTSAGYTLMPLIGRIQLYEGGGPVHGRHVALFFLVMVVSVAVIANLVVRLLHRRATGMDLVIGSLAFYGFLGMIQFMGRTDPLNLYPVMIPFVVLVAILFSRLDGVALSAFRRWKPSRGGLRAAAAYSLAGVLAVGAAATSMAVHEPFQRYPNVIRSLNNAELANETCLTDVPIDGRFLSTRGAACGATSTHDHERFKSEFPVVVAELSRRWDKGELVAIMDQDGPIFYQAADVPPWGKYLPLFPNLVTKARLAEVTGQLRNDSPENVMIRSKGDYDPIYDDIQAELFEVIHDKYSLERKIGTFELWRRQDLPPMESASR
ncbi:MAG TPA: hypothetical protein VHI31_08680 [Actinomycetota bacterium]|nr:hypothetical protein [Actinomycetota bacterium]